MRFLLLSCLLLPIHGFAQASAPQCAHPYLGDYNPACSCIGTSTVSIDTWGWCGWLVSAGNCVNIHCPWNYWGSCHYTGSHVVPDGKCQDVQFWACQSLPPQLPRCTNGHCNSALGNYGLTVVVASESDCPNP